MKFLKYLVFVFIFSNLGFAQNQNPELYNRPFIIYEGCETQLDKEHCYEVKLHDLLAKQINRATFKDSIISKVKSDTIVIHSNLLFDERGRIVRGYSSISSPIKKNTKFLRPILDSIPLVQPALDTYDKGVSLNVSNSFGFYIDRPKDSIVPLFGYTPEEIPFAFIEKVPIYKGCNKDLSNEDLKKCMSDKVREVIAEHFDSDLANKVGLSPGLHRINVMFNVNKKGRVENIIARGPHFTLEEEAIRVIEKIPRLKEPGYQKGEPVIVRFAIPIVFRVTE